MNESHRLRASGPRLIELAGPAGVGKSSLSAVLQRRLNAVPATIWGLPVIPLLGNGVELIPTFSGLWLRSKRPLWGETRHMVRLRTLHRALEQRSSGYGHVILFDEGPVFSLAWLRGFGHETLREAPSAEWWRTAIQDWASVLDVVVALDAPDLVLARRIRARPHPHEVKEFPDAAIASWMARFREALDWVLGEMARHGGPTVIRLSTENASAEGLTEQVLEALEGASRAG